MTPDEFDFWQRAYLAALTGKASLHDIDNAIYHESAHKVAYLALKEYRKTKATVVNKISAGEND